MGKMPHLLLFITLILPSGCMLDRSGAAPPVWDDAEIADSGDPSDSGQMDADLPDAGSDAGLLTDAGFDSGLDAGMDGSIPDSGIDAGTDAGSDAGPPRRVTFVFDKTELAWTSVASFWIRRGTGAWESASCAGGIMRTADTFTCEYDVDLPRGTRHVFRWYASDRSDGTTSSCIASNCTFRGSHRVLLDGVMAPPADLSEEAPMSPFPPAGSSVRVVLYVTPL